VVIEDRLQQSSGEGHGKMARIKTEAFERASYVATICAAGVAVLAFVLGGAQFIITQRDERETLAAQRETLHLEREKQAIDLTLKFIEGQATLARKNAAYMDERRNQEEVAIAEAIFNIAGDDPGWKATVKWMIEDEAESIKSTHLGCESFSHKFITYVKGIVGPHICD
jgi:hypothetical protein